MPGNKCQEEVLSLPPMFPAKRFGNFSPCLGDAQRERLDAFRFFFKQKKLCDMAIIFLFSSTEIEGTHSAGFFFKLED